MRLILKNESQIHILKHICGGFTEECTFDQTLCSKLTIKIYAIFNPPALIEIEYLLLTLELKSEPSKLNVLMRDIHLRKT